jgi:hypothetical protein
LATELGALPRMTAVDTLLCKVADDGRSDGALVAGVEALAARLGFDAGTAAIMRGLAEPAIYVYFDVPAQFGAISEDLRRCESEIAASALLPSPSLRLARLARCRKFAGASAGGIGRFHYVVETDVDDDEAWDDLAHWYDVEHMPGLAAVPGCVRAQRYVNLDGGPRSYACYDLAAPDVLASPAWLAVRNTPWSARVRPRFRNTARTMFRAMTSAASPQ